MCWGDYSKMLEGGRVKIGGYMYQPKETTRGGIIPPRTRSSVEKNNRKYNIKISVDTTEIDKALDKFREMERIYDKIHGIQ